MGAGMGTATANAGMGAATATSGGTIANAGAAGLGAMAERAGFAGGEGMNVGISPGVSQGFVGRDFDKGFASRGFDRDDFRFNNVGFGFNNFGFGGYGYPAFLPAYYGGDQGACYQACVNSGQYSPAQCGQMCYYA